MRNLGIFGNSVSSAPSGYSDVILADGPLGYWRFGESSGTTAVDVSGNNLNGTYNSSTYVGLGQPSLIPSDPDNKAILFKNTTYNGYRFKANPGAAWSAGNFAVEFVFKPATVSKQKQVLFTRNTGSGIDIYLIYDRLYVNAGQGFIMRSDAIQNLSTYHVVLSAFNGCSLFVNGALEGYDSVGDFSAAGEIDAGVSLEQGIYSYYGYMDELSVWNYALSQTRIQAHYAAMVSG